MQETNKKRMRYESKVYLGKELYTELTSIADTMGLSLSKVLRLMLNTGFDFVKSMERGINKDGK